MRFDGAKQPVGGSLVLATMRRKRIEIVSPVPCRRQITEAS